MPFRLCEFPIANSILLTDSIIGQLKELVIQKAIADKMENKGSILERMANIDIPLIIHYTHQDHETRKRGRHLI
jgi:hypothetical protein